MNWFSGNGRSLIGVDSGGRFVKAVQLVRGSGGWRLGAALRLPKSVSGEAGDQAACGELSRDEVAQLCGALARQGFIDTRIVLAVPEDKIVTGILELPPRASGAPLADIARLELASMNGYDAQQAETVSWDLPPSPHVARATQAMAVACRHADAEAMIEIYEGAGLQVVALDSRLHAIVRACRPHVSPAGITGILELEWDGAVLILLYRGVVIYRWSVGDAAVRHLSKTMADGLGVDEATVVPLMMDVGLSGRQDVESSLRDAVAGFIRKHVSFLAESIVSPLLYAGQQYPGSSVDNLLVVGHGAAIPGAALHLQSHLAGSVKTIVPADLVQCPDPMAARSRDPSLVSVVGLAQFEV